MDSSTIANFAVVLGLAATVYTWTIDRRDRARRVEDEKRDRDTDQQAIELKSATQTLIRTEMELAKAKVLELAMTKVMDLQKEITANTTLIEEVDKRLRAGDGHFKHLDEQLRETHVEILKSLNELQSNMATKADVKELREEMNRHA